MAIVEMRKINLVAMSYEKDELLNVLSRTGAVEVKSHADLAQTDAGQADDEELRAYSARLEAALTMVVTEVDNACKDRGVKSDVAADGFAVPFSTFLAMGQRKAEMDELVSVIDALFAQKNEVRARISRAERDVLAANLYRGVTVPLSEFTATAHVRVKLGTVAVTAKEKLFAALDGIELCSYEELATDGDNVLLSVACHRNEAGVMESALSEAGFTLCPFVSGKSGAQIYADRVQERELALAQAQQIADELFALKDRVADFKIYCDYVAYQCEKAADESSFRTTEKTVLLEGYVPVPMTGDLEKALAESGLTVYYEFSEPTAEDTPPTLMKNNRIVSDFESITNMYSVPNYRELDPNGVMAFFYSVFMGFIIGDAGYGLLMALVGGYLAKTKKGTGMGKLCGVFAIGGIFAIVWGLLFNSLFGIAVLPFTFMPNAQSDFCTFAGVTVPSVLVISMLIGIVQLLAGYVCKGVQNFRRGQIGDGIFEGIVWAVFSLGVIIAIVGLTDGLTLGSYTVTASELLTNIGAITAGASLLIAVLTAGRHEKFFGKFTAGFGAAYGVINYASDILSYARLYGLMLSGAVIAGLISQYSIDFITSGNIAAAIGGVLLMVIGHGFNIAMSLLGAYIHDARLQYVEFYGRFYEGEGELFRPLGSSQKYVSVQKS